MFLHILTTEWTSTRRKCRWLPAIPAWLDVYMHVFSLKSIKACSEGAKLTYFRHVNHNNGCCLIQLVQRAAGQDGEAADGLVRPGWDLILGLMKEQIKYEHAVQY